VHDPVYSAERKEPVRPKQSDFREDTHTGFFPLPVSIYLSGQQRSSYLDQDVNYDNDSVSGQTSLKHLHLVGPELDRLGVIFGGGNAVSGRCYR